MTLNPGDVHPITGAIKAAPLAGYSGFVWHGRVYVTKEQAKAAQQFGWKRVAAHKRTPNVLPAGLVEIER